MKTELRVGFAWQTLTSENLGVCALAEANLAIARTAASRVGVELSCIEFCPTGPSNELAISLDCERADPLSPRRMMFGGSRYWSQLRECDVVLDIGAGDSFSDIYGLKHFGFLSLSKLLARISRIPLVLSPQTIGPFKSGVAVAASSHLLRRAEKVFARDGLSMDYLRSNGLDANAAEVIDVAFRLPFEERRAPDDGRIHVGLNVSGLLFNGGYTRDNQFGLTLDYAKLVTSLLEIWSRREDVCVHLVGHVNSRELPVEDDYSVCVELAKRYPRVVVAPRFEAPSEAKSYMSALHFFTGARMHACIGAFSSGVPVVPMAYSRKFNGLFNSLGYRHLADLKVHDNATALQAVIDGFAARSELAGEVARGNQLAQQKLQRYEDYLVELFGSLRDKPH